MTRLVPAALVAAHLAATALAAQTFPVRHMAADRLRIASPGVAVIRTQAQWEMLWRRYSEFGRDSRTGALIPPAIPQVDFRREMVVAVGLGAESGCSNSARWIDRAFERRDTVVVELGPARPRVEVTCMMEIEPVDLVRLPRRDKPVVFRGPIRAPAPATWLHTPPRTALDALPDHGAHIALGEALDPATPPATVGWLVRWAARNQDANVGSVLLERPEVRRNGTWVALLTALPDEPGRRAKALLMRDFGVRMARDPHAPAQALRTLIEAMDQPGADPRVAGLLVRNPAVRRSREMLQLYTRHGQQNRALWREACRAWLARWPYWERLRGTPDNLPQYGSAIVCPDPPRSPPPARR